MGLLDEPKSLREVTLRNLLSFGPDTEPLALESLNVLIGPNGSGKSNFIEALGLLAAAPKHLATPVREGGGVHEWIWKSKAAASFRPLGLTASLDVVVKPSKLTGPLRHVIEFRELYQRFDLSGERIESADSPPGQSGDVSRYYQFNSMERLPNFFKKGKQKAVREDVAPDESILSQRKGADEYPEITTLGWLYSGFRLYRDWAFGPHSLLRQPQRTDQQADFLKPDGANLGLVLHRLCWKASVKQRLLEYLRELYDGIDDCVDSVSGGTILTFLHESGREIPATRLSDGTLRYLCLLAILCDPEPPPLVCIEEPELGLHPDIIPTLARLLKEASARTQLIVTTHSDILVDALSETPESVVVCEKHDGQTVMKRLEPDKLAKWLDKYRLGQLWIDGELGGNRW